MVNIGVRELRDGLSKHLALVKEGETIAVTEHGKPIARIVPAGDSVIDRLIAEGRITPARRPKGSLPDLLPGPLVEVTKHRRLPRALRGIAWYDAVQCASALAVIDTAA